MLPTPDPDAPKFPCDKTKLPLQFQDSLRDRFQADLKEVTQCYFYSDITFLEPGSCLMFRYEIKELVQEAAIYSVY